MTVITRVQTDVATAITVANAKHGSLTKDPVRACAILGREWGEAMNEALLVTKTGRVPHPATDSESVFGWTDEDRVYHRKLLYNELAQVAATAILMMEGLVDHQP